jgi:4-amino-4-deoxy-L-arabinose transferase-like glycosyltransferase
VEPSDVASQWLYPCLAVLIAVAWLATLSSRPLFNPDEGRYAEIPREILSGGDWLIPHLNGLAYVEKPPLQYWATALSLRLFGQNEFAARLYTALCALGTLAVVWLVARRSWGPATAWRAAAMLASMLLFVVLGQLLTLDMSLTFYMTASLGAFLLAQREPRGAGRLVLVAWAATGLGVLTKGLVAGVIPAAVLILYSAATRDFAPWRRLRPALGVPLFLLITIPWHWLAAHRLADFLQFYFVHEHLSRYMTPSADREEVWWFFGAVFVLGSLPWSVSAARVLISSWRPRRVRGEFDVTVFLWIWMVFVCVFFSLSDSKLIPYILPAMPALALLMATLPEAARRLDLKCAALLTLLAALMLAIACGFGPRLLPQTVRNGFFLQLTGPLAQTAALLGVSAALTLVQRGRDLTRAGIFLAFGWCLAGMLLMRSAAAVAPVYSGITLARALGAVPRDEPIYSVGTYDQTLPFYSQRTVQLVAYRGELDFGLRHDPSAEIQDVAQFLSQWQGVAAGYAVMEIPMFEDLKGRGVPMREIARDVHRVLVARR